MPPLTLGWVAFNSYEFQHYPDMFPFLPCLCFWTAWLLQRGVKRALGVAERAGWRRAPTLEGALLGILALALALRDFADPVSSESVRITLEQEKALVRQIVEPAGADGTVMSFSVEEVYCLSERRAPVRFLRLVDAFVPFLHLIDVRGCNDVLERLLRERPEVVVLRQPRRSSRCERRVPELLLRIGYAGRRLRVGPHIWQVFRADGLGGGAARSRVSLSPAPPIRERREE